MPAQLAVDRSTRIAPTYLVSLEGPNAGIAFVHASTSLGPIEACRLARVHVGMSWNTVGAEVTPAKSLDGDVRRAPYVHGREDAHLARHNPAAAFTPLADGKVAKIEKAARKMRR